MDKKFNFHELKAADRLPSPSGTALALMKLVQSDDSTIQQVAQLLQSDAALTGRIIGFANSAAIGARRPVVSIQDAVALIGMTAVRNFALSLSLLAKHREGLCVGFNYSDYWSRSLMLAIASSGIVARDRTAAPEEVFTLGLLSDIGCLALATAWPENFSACVGKAAGRDLLLLEQEYFAIDHEALTLILLDDWGFPAVFLEALKQCHHSAIDPSDTSRIARIARQLVFANHVTDYCLADQDYRETLLPGLQTEAGTFSLDDQALATFVDDLVVQWKDWGKRIDIKTDLRISRPDSVLMKEPDLLGLDVLLVDDDPIMLTRLTKQLVASGHSVQVCRDGETALEHIIEHKPQLLITDWNMKPMDGLALCKTLRASDFAKNLYIIMLTASSSEDNLVEAFDAGIDDYVTKPVNMRILLARIHAGQRLISLQQELAQERKELERSTAELAVANRRLQHIAYTDILTALPNRRYALNRLEQEWVAAQRFNRPLSVLMLDLDFFKTINDALGHDVGDRVLAHSAKVMRESIRSSDVACRLGGEEFIVIAPNTDSTAAVLLAERIRKAIEVHQLKNIKLPRLVTVSIGVASVKEFKASWNDLIKSADQAVYRVKEKNRNAVLLAT
ncbi:MAG: diguanylate cyclase [Methylococcaceae bacterium]|nr:diguanylate cyclase [Methylococcaceae bacterium]